MEIRVISGKDKDEIRDGTCAMPETWHAMPIVLHHHTSASIRSSHEISHVHSCRPRPVRAARSPKSCFSISLVRSQILSSSRQCLPDPTGQLISNQAGKHHHILRRLRTPRNRLVYRRSLVLLTPQPIDLVRQSNDCPDHDVSDGAGDSRGHEIEGLRLRTDSGNVASGFGGDHIGCCYGLGKC